MTKYLEVKKTATVDSHEDARQDYFMLKVYQTYMSHLKLYNLTS